MGFGGPSGREGREVKSSNEVLRVFLAVSKDVMPEGGICGLLQKPEGATGGWMWGLKEVTAWASEMGTVTGAMLDDCEEYGDVETANEKAQGERWRVMMVGESAPGLKQDMTTSDAARVVMEKVAAKASLVEDDEDEDVNTRDPRTEELANRLEEIKQPRRKGLGVKRVKMKARAPPSIHECLDPLGRWKLTWKGRWAQREHINVLELRTITKTMRRLSMMRGCWRKKILILTDSMAALGSASKGRSSSYPLLRQCKVLCALQLGLQMLGKYRYIESERNPSDGPSRGLEIGAAAETVLVHALRMQQRKARVRNL